MAEVAFSFEDDKLVYVPFSGSKIKKVDDAVVETENYVLIGGQPEREDEDSEEQTQFALTKHYLAENYNEATSLKELATELYPFFKKELARDLMALGSAPLFILVLVRIVIAGNLRVIFHMVVAVALVTLVSYKIKNTDFHWLGFHNSRGM